jgi:hypothetical protein
LLASVNRERSGASVRPGNSSLAPTVEGGCVEVRDAKIQGPQLPDTRFPTSPPAYAIMEEWSVSFHPREVGDEHISKFI